MMVNLRATKKLCGREMKSPSFSCTRHVSRILLQITRWGVYMEQNKNVGIQTTAQREPAVSYR